MALKARKFSNRNTVDVVAPVEKEEFGSLLTEKERREIEDEILAEIADEERERQKEQYRVEAKRKLKVKKGLEKEQITVTIDVAGHASKIVLDGQHYHHGYTYTVPHDVASHLYDVMGRTWDHEESVGGANQNEYRKPRDTTHHAISGITTNAPNVNSTSSISKGRMAPGVKF